MRNLYLNFFFVLISIQVVHSQSNDLEYEEIAELTSKFPDSAYQLALRFQEKVEIENDTFQIGQSFYLLGLSQYFQSRYYVAKDFFSKAIFYLSKTGDKKLIEACFNNVGICEEILGNLDQALDAYLSSQEIAKERGDNIGTFQTEINIALLEIKTGKLEVASTKLTNAKKFFEQQKDTLNLALVIQNQAKIANEKGALDDFILLSLDALKKYQGLNYLPGIIEIQNNLGNGYIQLSDFKNAYKYLQSALNMSEEQGYESMTGIILKNMGTMYEKQKLFEKAEEFYLAAQVKLKKVKQVEQLESLYWILLNYYHQRDMNQKFTEQIENLRLKSKKYLQDQSLARIDELKQIYEYKNQINTIEKQRIQIKGEKNRFIYALITSILLLIILFISIYSHSVNRKRLLALYKANKKLLLESSQSLTTSNSKKTKYQILYKEIENFLKTPENYLNPNLDLPYIAKMLGTNETYISEAINQIGNKNLNQLLNSIRLKAVQEAIHNETSPKIVSEIYYRFGFKSTSTFYRVFKSELGMTPQQYITMKIKEKKDA